MEYIIEKAIKAKICSKYSRYTQRLVSGEGMKEKPMRELRGMKNKNAKHVKILNKSWHVAGSYNCLYALALAKIKQTCLTFGSTKPKFKPREKVKT